MTIAQHDSQQSEHPHKRVDARDHAHKVAAIVGLAETGLREAESERVTRDRLEDGIEVLHTLLTLPWSERTLGVDRVLHTDKGDLDESRLVEYLNRLKRGESSLVARHAMVRGSAQPVIGDGWAVAQHLYAVADGLMASEPQHKPQAPSPVHRGELPPASVPPEAAPVPEKLPQRVPGQRGPQPSQPPMYPPAPPETPAQQTGVLIERVKEASAAGKLSDSSVRAMRDAGFGQQQKPSAPSMTPPPAEFSATTVPQTRKLSDTVAMRADEVLAALAEDDEPTEPETVEPRPFAPAAVESSPSTAGSRSGVGDD